MGRQMSDHILGKIRGMMEQEFYPPSDLAGAGKPEDRIARAAEYTAHHMGRTSRALERIVELLEKQTGGK